jgi:NifU-like protein
MGADFIDRHLRDKADLPAFPDETSTHLNLVVGAIENTAAQCHHIPLPTTYVTPAPLDIGETLEGGYPGFMEMPKQRKVALIEQVIAEQVRPYIELDAGGIEILDLLHDRELIIAYQGTCTTCHSATGTTLSYIQYVLRAKVHPDLSVVPAL